MYLTPGSSRSPAVHVPPSRVPSTGTRLPFLLLYESEAFLRVPFSAEAVTRVSTETSSESSSGFVLKTTGSVVGVGAGDDVSSDGADEEPRGLAVVGRGGCIAGRDAEHGQDGHPRDCGGTDAQLHA